MKNFQLGTPVRVAGDQATITYIVDSFPAVDNGKIYVTIPDQTQGFWIDPGQLVAVADAKHPYTGGDASDKAWHDQRSGELQAAAKRRSR